MFWASAGVVGFVLGVASFALCEWHAQRAERIYKARHRDHSAVPVMHWIDRG